MTDGPKRFYLYEYTNTLDGKRYIGVTCDLDRRDSEHRRGHRSSRIFTRAVKKHGFENFTRRVLAVFDDADAAAYHEQAAIVAFGTLAPNGYNLFAGAPYTRYAGTPSDETRAKLSDANRRVWADPEKRQAWAGNAARSKAGALTQEQRDAARDRAVAMWQDPDRRAQRSAALRGKAGRKKGFVCSPETRERMSAAKRRAARVEGNP